jgi:Fe-S-cluster containining protein
MEFELQCQRCAACCRWPGEVRVAEDEVAKLAAFLGVTEKDFIETYTRLRHDRKGLALKANSDHSCIFLKDKDCLVQAVKPQQCKDFPNRWMNLLWGKVPLGVMQRDYPMLFACSAFKDFLKSQHETRKT